MKFSVIRCVASVACAVVIFNTGCRNGGLAAPGPLFKQQADAVIHDPYPARDIGPVDLGSRPPGYEQPLPEPVRNRLYQDSRGQLGR